MNLEQRNEHIKRMQDGDRAKNFLSSAEWKDFLKPLLDSFVKGLSDIREIKATEDRQKSVEVDAKKLAVEYIESIEKWLEAYVIDGNMSRGMIDKELDSNKLYKEVGEE